MSDRPTRAPICPYCHMPSVYVTGAILYPKYPRLHGKSFWLCRPCDAYVGCHAGTANPLGRLANAELRAAKMRAHAAFDPIWRDGKVGRTEAYRWLANRLGLSRRDAHIGNFDIELCNRVVEACTALKEAA